jgi:fructokinase
LLVGQGQTIDVAGEEVTVADAVGAGDAFTAALLSAQLRGWPLATAAWFANHVGALVAGRRGAMPGLHNELGRLIARAKAHIHSDADSRLSRREKE